MWPFKAKKRPPRILELTAEEAAEIAVLSDQRARAVKLGCGHATEHHRLWRRIHRMRAETLDGEWTLNVGVPMRLIEGDHPNWPRLS
jgi:hypothetical protein